MSAAQALIVLVGLGLSGGTFVLLRFPGYRREQYRGEAFSMLSSATAAVAMLLLCLVLAWAQGQYESSLK